MPYPIYCFIAAYTSLRKFEKLWSAFLRYYFVRCSRNAFLELTNSRIEKKHGACDAIAFEICFWILAMCRGAEVEIILF